MVQKVLTILCLILFISCGGEDESIESSITFCNNDFSNVLYDFEYFDLVDTTLNQNWTIAFPDCFEHTIKQGIDSNVGDFESQIDTTIISYDIGYLAGVYVNSIDKTIIQLDDFELWYELRDSLYYFSFPDLSANFYTSNMEIDELLKIMESVEKK